MTIRLSDYSRIKECQGNKNNLIYLVRHKLTKRMYIIKIIKMINKENQLREIKIHQSLDHPNIVKLVDFNIKEDAIIMLIEYAEGGDLFSLLPMLKRMEPKKMFNIFFNILKALSHLHSKNIVHRDIKPENILIATKLVPKLADFGTSGEQKIIANTFCGTYEYMAPEIYLRQKHTDKVDVWAIGVLLYEMTHQKTPFLNNTLDQIKEKTMTRSITFKQGINPLVVDFIYKALNFDPLQRPSIDELMMHPIFSVLKSDSRVSIDGERKSTKEKEYTAKKNASVSITRLDKLKTHSKLVKNNIKSVLKIDSQASQQNLSVFQINLKKVVEGKQNKKQKPKKFVKSNKKICSLNNLDLMANYKNMKTASKKSILRKMKDLNNKLQKKYNSKKKPKSFKSFQDLSNIGMGLYSEFGSKKKKKQYPESMMNIDMLSYNDFGQQKVNLYTAPSIENLSKKNFLVRKKDKKLKEKSSSTLLMI